MKTYQKYIKNTITSIAAAIALYGTVRDCSGDREHIEIMPKKIEIDSTYKNNSLVPTKNNVRNDLDTIVNSKSGQ